MLGINAAKLRESGNRFSVDASMAKLYATEAAWRIADNALQIHGGYGYTCALPLERYLRDLRVFRIYEGSSEIQRNIIARALFKVASYRKDSDRRLFRRHDDENEVNTKQDFT